MPKIIARKEDWIKLGYELFSEKGYAGIVIETMAMQLKVNKSSFYWHFTTKKVFMEMLIEYWRKESTSDIITIVLKEKTPQRRFQKLVELSFKKDSSLDFFFFFKKYAKSRKQLSVLVDSLDKQRVDFTMQLLKQLGYSDTEASIKSSIFYKYLIGYHEMIRYKKQDKRYQEVVKQEIAEFINY